jgi:3-oxoacyl-[acyl-carrier-protein] synthase-1
LSTNPAALGAKPKIRILGGGLSNDANHISGPSRTGEELVFAVKQAMEESRISKQEIDFISAHGTATLFNDEMEAKSFLVVGNE